jgi:hypothetical protein
VSHNREVAEPELEGYVIVTQTEGLSGETYLGDVWGVFKDANEAIEWRREHRVEGTLRPVYREEPGGE